jgi:hypothetical protein
MKQSATTINPAAFRIWLLRQIDQLEHYRRHPEQDDQIWEWYPWIIEEASDRAARLGWFELFEQASRFPGRIRAMEAKGYLARCLAACNEVLATEPCESVQAGGETPTKGSASDDKGEGPPSKELSSRCENALRQYYAAEKQLGKVTDDEAYEWLREHCEEVDDPLPSKETWKRRGGCGAWC